MSQKTFLVVTTIADSGHPVLKTLANESIRHGIPFIVIGDAGTPQQFMLEGCDYFPLERQYKLDFSLALKLPEKHYARKNLGYLVAMASHADVIIETDDDNVPYETFWDFRNSEHNAVVYRNAGWVNVYRHFTDLNIWPRGFALEQINEPMPGTGTTETVYCPIQQGLADANPDVDAIYRLTSRLPVTFINDQKVALGGGCVCPFNSQNTTWFTEAFPLMYLPSYCSFRMTDIWRSLIAQQISSHYGWHLLFHGSTVKQERNEHNLMNDFRDEIPGYIHNAEIVKNLDKISLAEGKRNMAGNLKKCYEVLIEMKIIDDRELKLLEAWLTDIASLK